MTGRPRPSGERSLRFEHDGPTPSAVLTWLKADPPTHLAGRLVHPLPDDPEAGRVRLTVDDVVLDVAADDQSFALTISAEGSDAGNSTPESTSAELVELLDALTNHLGDPERAHAAAQIAAARTAANTNSAEGDDLAQQMQSLFEAGPVTIDHRAALRLVVECIDLTTLAGDDTPGRVRGLCAQAIRPDPTDPTVGPTAAVCVYPNLVPVAVELCKGSGVNVASVAGAFPSGLSSLPVRLLDISDAVASGATEIDVVINRAALLAGDHDLVRSELVAMRAQVGDRAMKVILETGELHSAGAIALAARLAIESGADWIKTSTGKSAEGASQAAVWVMAETVAEHIEKGGAPVGIKVSGGVRTGAEALGYLALVESVLGSASLTPDRLRFGASGLLGAVVRELAELDD